MKFELDQLRSYRKGVRKNIEEPYSAGLSIITNMDRVAVSRAFGSPAVCYLDSTDKINV